MNSDFLVNYTFNITEQTNNPEKSKIKSVDYKNSLELAVVTPFGTIEVIKNRQELAQFVFKEKIKINDFETISKLTKRKVDYTKIITNLNENLTKINELFSEKLEEKDTELIIKKPNADKINTTSWQVLYGNKSFYIGACTSNKTVEQGLKFIKKDLRLQNKNITVAFQPHVTLIPPHKNINPFTSLKGLADETLDITFDRISISKNGNINLLGKDDDKVFLDCSKKLANSLSAEPNPREPHTVIGSLNEEITAQFFLDSKQYGFETEEILERLVKNLPRPIKEKITFSDENFLNEQKILQIEFSGANSMTEEEIKKSKEIYKNRILEIKKKQDEIKHSKYKDKDREICVFNYEKLKLAVEGNPIYDRVPLTFSCRENGILLWKEFCRDVENLISHSKYSDVTIQLIGSGVHGFSRNPQKKVKSWSHNSDCDLSIFSKQMSIDCARQGVIVNESIQLNGKYVCYKNEKSSTKQGIGFHDTPIGNEFKKLQERWSKKLYGKNHAVGLEIDFKLNINHKKFKDAIIVCKHEQYNF